MPACGVVEETPASKAGETKSTEPGKWNPVFDGMALSDPANWLQPEYQGVEMTAKFKISPRLFAAILALAAVLATLPVTGADAQDFCWKNSYGRGVGKIPKGCASNEDKIGALCYPKCAKGMKRFGLDCHSACPAGFKSNGLFCRKDAEKYGGGVGRGKKKCEKKFGGGNCEKRAGLWYQKCRGGYVRSGLFCLPTKPDCGAIGMKKGLAGRLGCAKRIVIGKPRTGQCASGYEKNGGLCYKACRTGFKGAGPACWMKTPANWVACGMGAAASKKACGGIIFDQVTPVGELALNVATLGSSSAVTEAAEGPAKVKKIAELKAEYARLQKAWKTIKNSKGIKKAQEAAEKSWDTYGQVSTTIGTAETATADQVTPEDIARVAASIAALADPTGAAGVVASYTYPKCSKYFQ